MASEKTIQFVVDGIKFEFECYSVKRSVNIDEVIETIKKNSSFLIDHFIENEWTFSFRKFLPEGNDLTSVYFYSDVANKKIYFNTVCFSDDKLLNHYVSYAIIYTCDFYLLKDSYADFYIFKGMMATYFSSFIEIANETVLKMCDTYKMFNCYLDDDYLPIRFAYEYVSPYKFLYEAYALIIDGNKEVKEKCPGLYDAIRSTYLLNLY